MRVAAIVRRTGVLVLLVIGLFRAEAHSAVVQAAPDRVWLAARYDRTRVVIYFDAVQFKSSFPQDAKAMAAPAAEALFMPPFEIPAGRVVSLPTSSRLERFALGDHYDLLLDKGHTASVVLTTIVASQGDEEVGNDSYVGALATLAPSDLPFFTREYYAVRRSGGVTSPTVPSTRPPIFASLSKAAIPAATTAQIRSSLRGWITRAGSSAANLDPNRFPPVLDRVQAFTLSGGGRRYFVSSLQESPSGCARLRAWLRATPALKVLAADFQRCDGGLKSVPPPLLLDVLEIGGGRTGLVVDIVGFDGRSLHLLEYVDGLAYHAMDVLWAIDVAE